MTSWCFWGAEVKAGEPLKFQPIDGKILHLSQACLGETKKGRDQCVVYVKAGDQKLVLGNLSSEKIPQLVFDLVFVKEFELSHNLKNGSVHFCGYQKSVEEEEEDSEFSSSDSGEDLPMNFSTNGIRRQEVVKANLAPYKTNAVKPLPESSESDDESSESDDESDSDDDSSSDSDESEDEH